jgi:hypothetical protein
MEPAQTIIRKFGGPSAVSTIVGVHRTRVSNWQRAKRSGGTGGIIPQKHHRKLIDYALERGINLSADEFLPPRGEVE